MRTLAQKLLAEIRGRGLLKAGDRVGVAVSGGVDSVALLRLLLELRSELGIVLSVVHFNHKLRANESDQDERFVAELAQAHGLEFHRGQGEVRAYAAEHGVGIEAAARAVRYEFFWQVLRDGNPDRIATAHTLDDQAETLLLRLARGTGTRGLAGIHPRLKDEACSQPSASRSQPRQPAVVRPLLGVRRAELAAYLSEIGQDWREDSSNQDFHHARNRVRHELLPWLGRNLNPAIRERLAETAEIARAEEDYWQKQVEQTLPLAWEAAQNRLRIPELAKLPLAMQRRVLRAACESLGLPLDFQHVEDLLRVAGGAARAAVLPAGWEALREKDRLHFRATNRVLSLDYQYWLPVPGKVAVREVGTVFEAVVVEGPISGDGPETPLDYGLSGNELQVRNWRAGDRFWPQHRKEPRKIKELLQERHIVGPARKSWPVIARGDCVVWMRGYGASQSHLQRGENAPGLVIREIELRDSGNRGSDRGAPKTPSAQPPVSP